MAFHPGNLLLKICTVFNNSIVAVVDEIFVLENYSAVSLVGLHLRRLATVFLALECIFSNQNFA